MGPKSAIALAEFLARNQSIKSLNLGGNNALTPADWMKICEGLAVNESVESLNLDYCEMHDEAALCLFETIKNKKNLKIMDLDGEG